MNAATSQAQAQSSDGTAPVMTSGGVGPVAARVFAWLLVLIAAAYLINNYLVVWLGLDAPSSAFSGGAPVATIGVYLAAVLLALGVVFGRSERGLRGDAETLHRANLFVIRAAFWAVFLIGLADAFISFLRVEDLLDAVFGEALGGDLSRSQYRGPYVHLPLVALGVALAAVTRTLGFQWLALAVVIAELAIVIGRFVFSYEQTFMSDLVRFWYAGLFLFASAYTLYEDGHVRVDVLYAGFSDRLKGWINAIGCVILGATLCASVLAVGLADKTSIINGPLLNYETSQSGFGMFIKYWMAVFLAVFATTMLIQFMSFFLESVADAREEPGKRAVSGEGAQ